MRPAFYFLIILLLFSSCVPMSKYRTLEERMKSVETQLSTAFEDDDDDGVVNQLDQEKDTKPGCMVDAKGITLDDDRDGIANCDDLEPFSPPGYRVDKKGVAQIPPSDYVNEDTVNLIIETRLSELFASQSAEPTPIPIPSIKLPVPLASGSVKVPPAFFMDATTYGSIYNQLAAQLGNAGYVDQRYFQVLDADKQVGFAILTSIEEIDERGERKQFNQNITNEVFTCGFDFSCIYKKLSASTIGLYRTFLIIVRDSHTPENPYVQNVSNNYFNNTFEGGATSFNGLGLSEKMTNGFDCQVYVYEFAKKQETKPAILNLPSKLTANQHLEIARMRSLYYMPQ